MSFPTLFAMPRLVVWSCFSSSWFSSLSRSLGKSFGFIPCQQFASLGSCLFFFVLWYIKILKIVFAFRIRPIWKPNCFVQVTPRHFETLRCVEPRPTAPIGGMELPKSARASGGSLLGWQWKIVVAMAKDEMNKWATCLHVVGIGWHHLLVCKTQIVNLIGQTDEHVLGWDSPFCLGIEPCLSVLSVYSCRMFWVTKNWSCLLFRYYTL